MSPTTTPPPASQLQEENQRLKRAVEELSVLNDLARAIGDERVARVTAKYGRPLQLVVITKAGVL